MSCAALALPALSPEIPSTVYMAGKSGMPAALALALIEANVITDQLLAPANSPLVDVFTPPDEAALSSLALSIWWNNLREEFPTKFFHWDLHVQEFDHLPNGLEDATHSTAWFCLTRRDGEIPRFALEGKVMQLEKVIAGFGQTVLAVLYDALRHLPESLTPAQACNWAEWLHWRDSRDDEELLEELREENGYATVQELLDHADIFTREQFYSDMPYWAPRPERVISREQIANAAQDDFSRDVIAACDALVQVGMQKRFALRPQEIGCHTAGFDPGDGCVVLLWREFDVVGQVIDDALNQFAEGEATFMIDICQVPLTKANIRKFQARMSQMLQVARATERLIELIGEPL